MVIELKIGDCREVLKTLPEKSVHCCVTSPPYFNLRDYGVEGQIGLESSPESYVNELVQVFREVKRVLRDDGTLWLNLGDSYSGSGKGQYRDGEHNPKKKKTEGMILDSGIVPRGLKPKDLIGIPWRVAFALQADGWYLRQDIIWCLSGGNWVYVKSQKGVMPMMIKDLYRLKPETVQLWNGEKWTNLLGMSKSERSGDEIELVLRSGERISCTRNHKFPTSRGLLEASEIVNGDILEMCKLPDNDNPLDCAIGELAGWFAGLYIAEGSMAGDTIQISGHIKEEVRWNKIQEFARMYGASVTRTISGNKMDVRVYGKIPNAIISELVSGRTAIDKCFSPVCWQYSNKFLDSMLQGYLDGDGHNDVKNNRWRLGFTRNYNLERDLRTVCARLGYKLVLKPSTVKYKEENRPTFKGEIRKVRGEHWNNKQCGEVIEIRNARCRFVYDIGVEDEPHVFALASGVLTHNSKNNPMPESVRDRCTKSHEYIFLLSKSKKYYFDNEAIKEPNANPARKSYVCGSRSNGVNKDRNDNDMVERSKNFTSSGRNKRSVWQVNTKPYKGAHFATFPSKLIEPCILAGTSEHGVCYECGAPFERVTEKTGYTEHGGLRKRADAPGAEVSQSSVFRTGLIPTTQTVGWQPSCTCDALPVPATVLDPFGGSGTVGEVCNKLNRNAILIELNPEYESLIVERTRDVCLVAFDAGGA